MNRGQNYKAARIRQSERGANSDDKLARARGIRVPYLCHRHGGVDIDLDDGGVKLRFSV